MGKGGSGDEKGKDTLMLKDPPVNAGGPDPGREPWIRVIGYADQASPLGGGRSRSPVRRPVPRLGGGPWHTVESVDS